MRYQYKCSNPSCDKHDEIVIVSKPMAECSRVEYCEWCGEVIERTIESCVCGASIDNTGGFYRKLN